MYHITSNVGGHYIWWSLYLAVTIFGGHYIRQKLLSRSWQIKFDAILRICTVVDGFNVGVCLCVRMYVSVCTRVCVYCAHTRTCSHIYACMHIPSINTRRHSINRMEYSASAASLPSPLLWEDDIASSYGWDSWRSNLRQSSMHQEHTKL